VRFFKTNKTQTHVAVAVAVPLVSLVSPCGNDVLLSPLHDAELSDWAKYGKLRQPWEKICADRNQNGAKNTHR
jgi:hypothetical protein